MKRYFIGVLAYLGSAVAPAAAQIKPSEVEVWGLPSGTTREGFVTALNQKKQTVCMAAIRPMGYPEAQVIWLDSISLVTLRSDAGKPIRTNKAPKAAVVMQLNSFLILKQMHTPEFQMAWRSLYAVQRQDTAALNRIQRKVPRHQAATYTALLQQLQAPSKLTFGECLTVLRSAAPDSVREKALVRASSVVQTRTEVNQLLPFLRDPDLGTQTLQIARNFCKYHPVVATEWRSAVGDYAQALSTPNPIVVAGLASFLYEQKVPRQFEAQLMTPGALTMQEVLRGQHPSLRVFKQQLYPLLSYLSGAPISSDAQGLAYLEKFGRR